MTDLDEIRAPASPEEDGSDQPVREVYGSAENIAKLGSPIQNMDVAPIRYYFYPTWRSQLMQVLAYLLLCWLTLIIAGYVPQTIITGKLFDVGDTTYMLSLPLFILAPGFMLGRILFYIYNSRYIVDERGVEAQVGLVSLHLRQPRLRYEDIRGVEPTQSLLERIIGIGNVLIGSAMTAEVEINMKGISNPRAIQLLIQGERDRRLELLSSSGKFKFSYGGGD